MEESGRFRKVWLNALLFGLTLLSTFFVGLGMSLSYVHPGAQSLDVLPGPGARAFLEPRVLLLGLLYSAVLMAILLGHELAHFLTCRRYGIAATLPFFIPAPNLIGTFGAVIKIKSPIRQKHQLFDVGVSGPLTGFLLALPALAVGLAFSKIAPVPAGDGNLSLGEPLLLKLLTALFFRHRFPPGADVVLHPVAFAGWVGLLVTALNLFPIGQLDGGHITYSLVGRKAGLISLAVLAAFVVMGVLCFAGWFLWGGIGLLFILMRRLKHPPILDEDVPLSLGRRIMGVVIVLVFMLSFIPDPVKGYGLLGLLTHGGAGVK
jgi:membrane-associated protease RseP (regulator of RpoE activity)